MEDINSGNPDLDHQQCRAELAAGLAQVEAFVRRGGGLQQAGEELEGLVL